MVEVEPYLRQDLFSFLMLFGILQAILLIYSFGFRKSSPVFLRFLGLLVASVTLVCLEIFLCYSGFILYAIELVDTTEPLNLLLGPLLYFFVWYGFDDKSFRKGDWLHFAPSLFYLAYSVLFHIQPEGFKVGAYFESYHPEAEKPAYELLLNPDPLFLKAYINAFTIIHLGAYILLSVGQLRKNKARLHEPAKKLIPQAVSFMGAIYLALIIVKLAFQGDLGDYIIAVLFTLTAFILNVVLLRTASFIKAEPVQEKKTGSEPKYSKSGLSQDLKEDILKKIELLLSKEKKFYLDPTINLQKFAGMLSVHPNYLSQVLNEQMGRSFFEFIAFHRIEEAQKLLADPANEHLTIEVIAEQVGYNSKSAFYSTFRKLTGKKPSEVRSSLQGNTPSL